MQLGVRFCNLQILPLVVSLAAVLHLYYLYNILLCICLVSNYCRVILDILYSTLLPNKAVYMQYFMYRFFSPEYKPKNA